MTFLSFISHSDQSFCQKAKKLIFQILFFAYLSRLRLGLAEHYSHRYMLYFWNKSMEEHLRLRWVQCKPKRSMYNSRVTDESWWSQTLGRIQDFSKRGRVLWGHFYNLQEGLLLRSNPTWLPYIHTCQYRQFWTLFEPNLSEQLSNNWKFSFWYIG